MTLLARALALVVAVCSSGCHGCDVGHADETSNEAASQDFAGERWVTIPPGELTMGSPRDEPCRDADEEPVAVTLTGGFVIAAHEVTQAAFGELMGYDPSWRRDCPTCPVDSVTHHEARAYCNALSRKADLELCYRCRGTEAETRCRRVEGRCEGFRLPTEAEWEHAARARTQTTTPAGPVTACMSRDGVTDEIAWYKVSSRGESHPVGRKAPNRWGLFDMTGNVYEWTADWYAPSLAGGVDPPGPSTGTERVLRGGSWYHNAEHTRSANRFASRPDKRLSYVGFRCARNASSSDRG